MLYISEGENSQRTVLLVNKGETPLTGGGGSVYQDDIISTKSVEETKNARDDLFLSNTV